MLCIPPTEMTRISTPPPTTLWHLWRPALLLVSFPVTAVSSLNVLSSLLRSFYFPLFFPFPSRRYLRDTAKARSTPLARVRYGTLQNKHCTITGRLNTCESPCIILIVESGFAWAVCSFFRLFIRLSKRAFVDNISKCVDKSRSGHLCKIQISAFYYLRWER